MEQQAGGKMADTVDRLAGGMLDSGSA